MGLKTLLLFLIIGLSSGVTLSAQYRFIDASSGEQVSLEKLVLPDPPDRKSVV